MIKYKKQKEYTKEELDSLLLAHNDEDRIKAIRNIYQIESLYEKTSFKKNLDKYLWVVVKDKFMKSNHYNYEFRFRYPRLNNLIKNKNWKVRAELAHICYRLDILIEDKDWRVRAEVARQGYRLDILIEDKDWRVRAEVARQGYRLDILVNDTHFAVREEVAKQGHCLNILIKDEDWEVRAAVVRQGFSLDILIEDEDYWVREEVAKQGYGLDILVEDTSLFVYWAAIDKCYDDENLRETSKEYLKEKEVKKKEIQLRKKLINLI